MDGNNCKSELFNTHFKGERDVYIMIDTVMELGDPDKVFDLVSRTKEEGNELFKRREFGLPIEQYDITAKYLLCTWMMSEVDSDLCKDLIVSLHLKLAVCAIKLGYFQRAFDLCSLIINTNPASTKGRFRRAKATLGVGLMTTAFEDLTTAARFGSQ